MIMAEHVSEQTKVMCNHWHCCGDFMFRTTFVPVPAFDFILHQPIASPAYS